MSAQSGEPPADPKLESDGGTQPEAERPEEEDEEDEAAEPDVPALTDVERQSALAAAKESRARDAGLAMQEYQDERRALPDKTERLRELRRAKEAADAPAKKSKKQVKKVR